MAIDLLEETYLILSRRSRRISPSTARALTIMRWDTASMASAVLMTEYLIVSIVSKVSHDSGL